MKETNHINKTRFETLIDGIFAIVITILILEFKVPHIENADSAQLNGILLDLIPTFLCYIVAFFSIVVIWLDHHNLFKAVKYITKPFALINFVFILTVSIIPFSTAFLGEYFGTTTGTVFFIGSLLIMNIVFTVVFIYPVKKGLIENGPEFLSQNRVIPLIGLGVEIIGLILAFVNPTVAFCITFIVLVLHLFKKN